MIHYPLSPITSIYKTKGETTKVSMENQATLVKELLGFTLLELRDVDYCFIAEEWENVVINTFRHMQERQFKEQYGEEY